MVEQQNFHEQLLVTACGHDDIQNIGTSVEHRQQLALDILTWVTAIKLNQPHKMYVTNIAYFMHGIYCRMPGGNGLQLPNPRHSTWNWLEFLLVFLYTFLIWN